MILALGPAAGAAAQTDETRGSAAVVAGGGRTWDDEGSLGTGLLAGGRADWRVFGTTRVEGALDVLTHDRSGGFFEAEGTSTLVSGTLVHRFGRASAQPYILGGVHIIRHNGSVTFDGVRSERTSTDTGYHFGGGAVFRVGERFEAGPEARFLMIQPEDDIDPALAYWIGVRFGVRF